VNFWLNFSVIDLFESHQDFEIIKIIRLEVRLCLAKAPSLGYA